MLKYFSFAKLLNLEDIEKLFPVFFAMYGEFCIFVVNMRIRVKFSIINNEH